MGAAEKVRYQDCKYLVEGKDALVTAGVVKDGITICYPNRVGGGVLKVFLRISLKPI